MQQNNSICCRTGFMHPSFGTCVFLMSAVAAIPSGYRAPSVDVRFFGKRSLRDTRLRIFKLDTFENVTFVSPDPPPSTPQQRGKKTSPTSSPLPRRSPPLRRPPPTGLNPTASLGPNPPPPPWLTATCAWRWPPLITTRTSSRWRCTGRCLSTVSYSTGQIKRRKKREFRFKASYRRIVHCIRLCS